MTPALLALTDPGQVPAAAVARLLTTGAALAAAAETGYAGAYAGWLTKAGAVATRLSPLLAAAVAGTATEAETAGLVSGERAAAAGLFLCSEIARRTTRREQIAAMGWATLHRAAYADATLTRREYAPNALLGLAFEPASRVAPIRILPGAEAAVTTLLRDPLLYAAEWDTEALAATLAQWVSVT